MLLTYRISTTTQGAVRVGQPSMTLVKSVQSCTTRRVQTGTKLDLNSRVSMVINKPPYRTFDDTNGHRKFGSRQNGIFLAFVSLVARLEPEFTIVRGIQNLLSTPLGRHPRRVQKGGFPSLSRSRRENKTLLFVARQLERTNCDVSFGLCGSTGFNSPRRQREMVVAYDESNRGLPCLAPARSRGNLCRLPG